MVRFHRILQTGSNLIHSQSIIHIKANVTNVIHIHISITEHAAGRMAHVLIAVQLHLFESGRFAGLGFFKLLKINIKKE